MANLLLNKLKPKRRWMRVSLRTVLVLVTLLCVVLSLWVMPMERKRRAVAAIEAKGGKVEYVSNEASKTTMTATEEYILNTIKKAVWCQSARKTSTSSARQNQPT